MRLNPNYAEAYAGRGASRYELGDKQGALADLTQAIKINPKYAEAYIIRGGIRAESGDKNGGFEDLQKAIELFPEHGNDESYKKMLELILKYPQ
ncbi:tetratricopeptide repeat protein [Fischerella thermalis]|uniref:tetratricopeptide repeat protein n=1 Tax=Fischerella thermalis TaxID=372787 RepID=UPI0021559E58|nr:tetratricopeptide repeat protein [Fischerella thermalis]